MKECRMSVETTSNFKDNSRTLRNSSSTLKRMPKTKLIRIMERMKKCSIIGIKSKSSLMKEKKWSRLLNN